MKSVSHAACLPWSAGTAITLQCFHIELENGLTLLIQPFKQDPVLSKILLCGKRVTILFRHLGVFPRVFSSRPKAFLHFISSKGDVFFLSAGIMAALAALE